MQSSRKLGNYVIKAGELVHDAVYFNTLALFKQWYTTYEDENEGKSCQVEYFKKKLSSKQNQ